MEAYINGMPVSPGNSDEMDDLIYTYTAGTNRLEQVDDQVPTTNYARDPHNPSSFDDAESSLFTYDEIGRMTNDANKGLTVEWNHLHKPYRVTTAQSITIYRYDPLGRRLSSYTSDSVQTLYARDPQGNTLATYRRKSDQELEQDAINGILNSTPYTLSSLVLYGSSRIGIINLDAKASPEPEGDNPGGGGTIDPQNPDEEYNKSTGNKKPTNTQNVVIFTEVIGLRRYEISNHLGNVLATYTDRKLWRKTELQDGSKWEGYDCDVASGTDYHAYGFAMAGRTWEGGDSYRFGFNGTERAPEHGGYTTEFRENDVAIGRWWSIDPINHEWQSPYGVNDGNPIGLSDVKGASTNSTHVDKSGKVIAVYDDGDKGIYRHNDLDVGQHQDGKKCVIDGRHEFLGPSAGGEKMGESLHMYSYTDFGKLEKGEVVAEPTATIDFNSTWAWEKTNAIVSANIVTYFFGARSGNSFDVKEEANTRFGSRYYGSFHFTEEDGTKIYSSARDVGNFIAGVVKEKSVVPNKPITLGYGAYNKAQSVGGIIPELYKYTIGDGTNLPPPHYGEDIGSSLAIQRGATYQHFTGWKLQKLNVDASTKPAMGNHAGRSPKYPTSPRK